MPCFPTHFLALILFCLVSPGHCAPSQATVQHSGKTSEIRRQMQGFVDKGVIAGAVTLVAHNGKIVAHDPVGQADIAKKQAMGVDNLFWIASMTKPITATAVMMLQDEGKLNIEDPVEKYLPEFKNQWLVQNKTSNAITLVPAPRPITLRDLLTHTSGLGEVASPRPNSTLAELVMAYSQQPLKFAPGSKWEYCNSGITTLGRVVEVVSGQKYEVVLERRIFRPLGMKETTFWPTPNQLKRLAKTYQTSGDGRRLEETNIFFFKSPLTDRTRTPFPSGGLFSTAGDMFRFYQMVLDRGMANGKRIVSDSAVAMMTATQTGNLKTGFTDGMSFGLGWSVVKEPTGVTGMLSPGTFGHGGAYGTQGWVDPQKRMIFVLMIQRTKFGNSDGSEVRRVFQETAAANF